MIGSRRRRLFVLGARLAAVTLLAASAWAADNNAAFVSQSVPASMAAGTRVTVSLTFTNTGTTSWSAPGGFLLATPNPDVGATWQVSSVALPSVVAPGSKVTFNFRVSAPATPGTYEFQWQMESGTTFFGTRSLNVLVKVE